VNLLNLLNLPSPSFNPAAIGVATLVTELDDAGELRTELAIPVSIVQTSSGPAVRISGVGDRTHVEISLAQVLDFAGAAAGLDLPALFAQFGALV
jgi:hypothetical protein